MIKPPSLQSPMWRLPRLQLGFWRFGTVPGIVALFVASITGCLAKIPVLLTGSALCVAPGDQGTSLSPSFSTPFAVCFLLLLLPGLLRGFLTVLRSLGAVAA